MNRRTVLRLAGRSAAGALCGIATSGTTAHPTPSAGGRPTDDPTAPPDRSSTFAPLASLPVAGAREAVVGHDGTTVYLAAMDGFAVVDVSDPTAPRLLAERRGLLADADGGPLRRVKEVAVDEDRLLVVGPAEPVPNSVEVALLYDVSNPADPRRVAVYRTGYPIHNAALRDGRAYLTANDRVTNPIEIVDVRDGPTVLGRWSPVDEDGAWANVPQQIRPSHDVVVVAGVAYCSYWDAGTWLVDVRDPADPRAIGRVGERSADELSAVSDARVEGTELPGNHHSAAIDESGRLLAVGHEALDADGDGDGGPGGVTLVDVSTPEAHEELARIAPPPTADPSSDGEWITAHNFELRDGVLYSAWYRGGVQVHDVSNPERPRAVAAWRHPGTASFWTAQVAEGAVVASSRGTGTADGEPGLFTFPLPD